MIEITSTEFNLLKEYLYNISGIAVPPSKRYLFNTRLATLLEEEGFKNFSQFYNILLTKKNKNLQRKLVQAMTTHESSFFRDKHPFVVLEKILLPQISRQRISEATFLPPRIRIFSAGCSLGQEPYSIAMYVHKWLEKQDTFTEKDVTILAGDISQKILARAQKGIYSKNEMGNNFSDKIKNDYFIRHEAQWEVKSEIRNMVRFVELNLSEPINQLGTFDIIFCRNVIIYFPIGLKREILKQFYSQLNSGGTLIMGSSESLYNLSTDFTVKQEHKSTFYIPNK